MHLDLPSIVVSSSDEPHSDGASSLLMPLMVTQMAFSQRKWKTMSSLRQQATSPTSPVARNVYSRGSVDVESGEVHQQHNGHKRPYTPGASPREILLAAQSQRQLPSPSTPHGSRFMDGYRRRMRQASLNLPSDTQLDEDLGFPPVCSPPPEVFCGSISGNHMRMRSNSDAYSGMRMQSSHSLGNGSHGGLLVFFPTSPSSSSNNSSALVQRRESHTDETAEEAIHWSTNNDNSDEMMVDEELAGDDVSMKDVEVAAVKSLKRPPDLINVSNNTGSMCNAMPNAVHATNSYSPRQRPLFVDTQMANMDTTKRRSPVSQVVDFVRGRNRTYSLQLTNSPMMSPQSVAARASASCDTQPANSPGRRQTMSGRVHRASFTASGGLKSFDSGLDLSSPINHTALLIKEVRSFLSLGKADGFEVC